MADRCENCIHVQMCKWAEEMVDNHTCDWYREERPHGECRNCTHYNLFGLDIDKHKTYCQHPKLYCDDPFCGVALETKPQDTCSYFAPKGGDEK